MMYSLRTLFKVEDESLVSRVGLKKEKLGEEVEFAEMDTYRLQ